MGQTDNCIDYIEFEVTDIERAKRFYGAVFGWTFTDYGPEYCEFDDGRMKGGFSQAQQVSVGGPLVVLYHRDLDALMKKIEENDGRIARPVFQFPGGERFEFYDPDGHKLAVWRKT